MIVRDDAVFDPNCKKRVTFHWSTAFHDRILNTHEAHRRLGSLGYHWNRHGR
jgi:hypothetical protein